MPTDTFLKLSEEKKRKILSAAKKEFSRVSIEEASIKNIVEEAGIARGSFYQYFNSKEDVLTYIMKIHFFDIERCLKQQVQISNGDPFAVFLFIYDYVINECFKDEDLSFYRKIFENMKTREDNFFSPKEKYNHKGFFQYYKYFNQDLLRVKNEKDVELIIRMLFAITKKAIVSNFEYESKKEARKDFLKQIEYLKYGILKQEGEVTKC